MSIPPAQRHKPGKLPLRRAVAANTEIQIDKTASGADSPGGTDLARENQLLRRRLRAFVAQARENEQKMQRFHEQELRLIGTASLSELVHCVLYDYRSAFQLDIVSLVIHDAEYEIKRFLDEAGVNLAGLEQLLFQDDVMRLDNLFGISAEPQLGPYKPNDHSFLFAPGTPAIHSVALLPLVRYGQLIGSLNLGSSDPSRYIAGSATDFLQRLATIVAISLENAANHERLKRVGLTDALTGVNNRRFFDQRLLEEASRAVRTRQPLACLFMDVDHFKSVNDRFGHKVGDQVLWEVAGIIREQLRSSDVLGRYGGEEFAALLVNADTDAALEIAQRIRTVIQDHVFDVPEVEGLAVTISIGIAMLAARSSHNDTEAMASDLVGRADQAVYKAKQDGRNRVVLGQSAPVS